MLSGESARCGQVAEASNEHNRKWACPNLLLPLPLLLFLLLLALAFFFVLLQAPLYSLPNLCLQLWLWPQPLCFSKVAESHFDVAGHFLCLLT